MGRPLTEAQEAYARSGTLCTVCAQRPVKRPVTGECEACYKRRWRREGAKPKSDVCKRGHERTPENTYVAPDGRRCRLCMQINVRAYYEANRDELRMRGAARYQANREFLLAQVTAYYHENSVEIRNKRHRQRQRDGQDVSEGAETVAYMRMIVADPCAYCGTVSTADDHIVPLSAGGEHHWLNMTRACLSCNSRKRTRPLLHWLLARLEAA